VRRAAVIGITWPTPDGLDDTELERRLFTPPTFDEKPARPLPDWSHVHKELKRRAVTLLLLWEEYRAEHTDGYGYSRFCDLYRDWCKTISPTMRQTALCGHARGGPMPAERAPMRKIREVLRLRYARGVSERQFAITTGLSRSARGRREAVRRLCWRHGAGVRPIESRTRRNENFRGME
jgi:hypothetical protein